MRKIPIKCSVCHGHGNVPIIKNDNDGMGDYIDGSFKKCDKCNGTGSVMTNDSFLRVIGSED